MDSNILSIQLTPRYEDTAESMGLDLNTMDADANNNAILSLQGWGIKHIEVRPGEEFIIPLDVESAIISCEEIKYKVISEEYNGSEGSFYSNNDYIDLKPGKYRFLPDGRTVKKLSGFR